MAVIRSLQQNMENNPMHSSPPLSAQWVTRIPIPFDSSASKPAVWKQFAHFPTHSMLSLLTSAVLVIILV